MWRQRACNRAAAAGRGPRIGRHYSVGMSNETSALQALAGRHSQGPKYMVAPAPSRAQWQQAADLALRAPDHGGLRPFRFVLVSEEQRAPLAELFVNAARRWGQSEAEELQRAHERAWNGPGLAALIVRLREGEPEVPAHEQLICAGAGLMNFLNALHLMGYAAKTLSGAALRDPALQAAFCRPGEQLLAWVLAGTPLKPALPRARPVGTAQAQTPAQAEVCSVWEPPAS